MQPEGTVMKDRYMSLVNRNLVEYRRKTAYV